MARHNKKHEQRKAKRGSTQAVVRTHTASRANPEEIASCANKIRTFLTQTNKRQLPAAELARKCKSSRCPDAFRLAMEQLLRQGVIFERRSGYALSERFDCFPAVTVRLARSFGFIADEEGTEYFVPGKFLMGSMPGDRVLARRLEARSESPEAEVTAILEESESSQITGKIVTGEGGLYFLADTMSSTPLHIDYRESVHYAVGDKVLAVLTQRGRRHMEHRVKIILNFGTADNAENCMAAKIAGMDIPVEFPAEVLREAEKLAAAGVTAFDMEGRCDLRGDVIFTIDGASSKDLDDAVSIRRTDKGWELGVHIADVSHYVRPNSRLDAEAFERGTSIYYADKVIPMLPPALSNGICSLNGGEDRLACSALMEISAEGDLLDAKFCKSVINSRVRGVYSECNEILEGSANDEILAKYAPVMESLQELDRLTQVLEQRRIQRGAPELESTETAVVLDENGICVGIVPRIAGRSEGIIEACMLMANQAAARLARTVGIPLVYRVHEDPAPERVAALKEMLCKLGQPCPDFDEASPRDMQQILNDARDKSCFPIVNKLTLRSMAKARYSHEPLGHFGLALRDYAHFTSPIRRYPDLVVHRILSDYLDEAGKDWLCKRYGRFTENAAEHSSAMEVRAVAVERDADDCYAAEFMLSHVGETFHGIISSVTDFGIYVTLDNYVEGLLHINDMQEGSYEIEDGWYLKESFTGRTYRLGEELTVLCAKADVNSGKIDFVLADSSPLC